MTYGHLIRNTLLLAAMEFENECKGVLVANNYVPPGGPRWNTTDFVKVLGPLRLQEYEVHLNFLPSCYPTQSISELGSSGSYAVAIMV